MLPNSLGEVDWGALRVQDPEKAVSALQGILTRWDGIEEKAFAVRGMVALIMEERELWQIATDPDTGQPYASLDQWFRTASPISHSSWRDALRTIKELRDTPLEELMRIKRCNLEQMKKISSGIRKKAAVLRAAQTLPEKDFVRVVNEKYPGQYLEVKRPIVMAPEGDCTEFEQAIEMAMLIDECKDRAEAIKAISIAYLQDKGNQLLYERMKAGEHLA
jgi:hypothetical protein